MCRRLWRHDTLPTIAAARNIGDDFVTQQAAWITNDLSRYTLNRRKVINALAYHPANEPQGQDFSQQAGLNPSAIKKCITDLQKLDMIYLDKNGYYRIMDPALAYYVRKHALRAKG